SNPLWFPLVNSQPLPQRIPVCATNGDLFFVDSYLMDLDRLDVPDGNHIGLMHPDKIRLRHQIKNIAHAFPDKNNLVIQMEVDIISLLLQIKDILKLDL